MARAWESLCFGDSSPIFIKRNTRTSQADFRLFSITGRLQRPGQCSAAMHWTALRQANKRAFRDSQDNLYQSGVADFSRVQLSGVYTCGADVGGTAESRYVIQRIHVAKSNSCCNFHCQKLVVFTLPFYKMYRSEELPELTWLTLVSIFLTIYVCMNYIQIPGVQLT